MEKMTREELNRIWEKNKHRPHERTMNGSIYFTDDKEPRFLDTTYMRIILVIVALAFVVSFGPLASAADVVLSDRTFSVAGYTALRSDLASKVRNMRVVPLAMQDVRLWIEVANREIPKCVFRNVTMRNLLDKINDCVAGV